MQRIQLRTFVKLNAKLADLGISYLQTLLFSDVFRSRLTQQQAVASTKPIQNALAQQLGDSLASAFGTAAVAEKPSCELAANNFAI